MTFGERLRDLRGSCGWRLRDARAAIERETGHAVALGYLSDLEKDRKSPTLATVARIAAGYGMDAQQLLRPVDLDARVAGRA